MKGTIVIDAQGETEDEVLEKLRTTLFNIIQENSNNTLAEWVEITD